MGVLLSYCRRLGEGVSTATWVLNFVAKDAVRVNRGLGETDCSGAVSFGFQHLGVLFE